MRNAFGALSIVLAKGSGAFFAFLSSLYIAHVYGKTDAGYYFVYFGWLYFSAQIIRFGGEVDILSSKCSSDISKALSFSVLLSIFCIFLGLFFLYFDTLFFVGSLSVVMIGLIELVSDLLKRAGKNVVGVFFGASIYHVFIIVSIWLNSDAELSEHLLKALSLASLFGVFLIYLYKVNVELSFAQLTVDGERWKSFYYNISQNIATPLFVSLSSVIYSSAIAADYRLAMRLSIIVHFTSQAFQQLAVRKLLNVNSEELSLNKFTRTLYKTLVPSLIFTYLISIVVAFFMVDKLIDFDERFIIMVLAWGAAFCLYGLMSPIVMISVANRRFSLLLVHRILVLIFVCMVVALIYFFKLNYYYFLVVTSGFYYLQAFFLYFHFLGGRSK
jgi:hypothetical protein